MVGIVRIYYIAKVQDQKDFTCEFLSSQVSHSQELPRISRPNGLSCAFSDIQVEILIWSLIEPCVGIVCACLSTLRPMFRAMRGGSQYLKSSGSQAEDTAGSMLRSLRRKGSAGNRRSSASFGAVNEQRAMAGFGDWPRASDGSDSMELRSIGFPSTHHTGRGGGIV